MRNALGLADLVLIISEEFERGKKLREDVDFQTAPIYNASNGSDF